MGGGGLVTRPKYPPLSRDRCSNALSHCGFLWYRRLSLLHPHFFPSRRSGLSQSKDRTWKGGIAEKLASEAYRAIGRVARNSITNRTKVGH